MQTHEIKNYKIVYKYQEYWFASKLDLITFIMNNKIQVSPDYAREFKTLIQLEE